VAFLICVRIRKARRFLGERGGRVRINPD
jgi:hypothetical protein